MNAPKTVKMVAKTAVGVDVTDEYKEQTGKCKKPWWMSQRVISIVVGVLCSTALAKLELDSEALTVIVMAVIDNKEAFSAIAGICGMVIVFIKGWVNKRKRNASQQEQACIEPPSVQPVPPSPHGIDETTKLGDG